MMMGQVKMTMMTVLASTAVILLSQTHEGGSRTSDLSPIPLTSQILIESINRRRGRESPDAGVKSAYVMTCSLAGWMNQAQSPDNLLFSYYFPSFNSLCAFFSPFSCVCVCVRDSGKELFQSCTHVCYFTAILDNDLFCNPQLESLPLEREW